jgi:hypothetical protein
MSDPKRVVLAPDEFAAKDREMCVHKYGNGCVRIKEYENFGEGSLSGGETITLTESEARHLRDWLCEQFGPPEKFCWA